MGARARPSGCLCPSPERFRAAELASLRQSSPPQLISGLGRSLAHRRLEVAPFDGAGGNVKTKDNYQLQRHWILDY